MDMKKISIALIIFLVLNLSCGKNKEKNGKFTCECKKINLIYSKLFEIFKCRNDSFILKIKIPQNEEKNSYLEEYYILSKSKKNFPIKKVGITSTTFIGFLEHINEINSITMIDNINYYSNKKILDNYNKGKIKEIGNVISINNVENIIKNKPDVIFINPNINFREEIIEILKKSGIEIIKVVEYLEPHPLGRAEWIKFFSIFYDKLELGQKIFNLIKKEYEEISLKVKKINDKEKPKVIVEFPFNGIWYIPGGNTLTSKLIEDAGGVYIFSNFKTKNFYCLNFEEMYAMAKNADIWLNVGCKTKKIELINTEKRIMHFKSFKNNKIYTPSKQGNSNYCLSFFFEEYAANPHLYIKDLYSIFYNKNDSLFFYINLN